MKLIVKVLQLVDGRISKTKVTALAGAVVGVAMALGLELDPQQQSAVEVLLVAFGLLFLRDGIDNKG